MTTNLKCMIFFIGGATIGALGGIFGTKGYFEKKANERADETITEMKELIKAQYKVPAETEDIANPVEEEKTNEGPSKIASKASESPQDRVLSLEDIQTRLEENRVRTDYAAIYGQVHPESKTEKKSRMPEIEVVEYSEKEPEDEEEDEINEPYEEPPVVAYADEHKGRKPRLISAAKVAELPDGIDIVGLQFYASDEVLADENTEEIISDQHLIVGDCLTKYDFAHSDERTIYVMNYELNTCYEIVKIDASYEETH